jgi:hypothetical protein
VKKKYIKSLRKRLKATNRFFSSKNKFERECWIVKKFLNLKQVNELTKPDRDPPDVLYNGARFEVLEILDEGRKETMNIGNVQKKLMKPKKTIVSHLYWSQFKYHKFPKMM